MPYSVSVITLGKGTAKEKSKIAGSRFDLRHLQQNMYLLSGSQGKGDSL